MKVEEFQRYRRLYQGSPSAKRILVEQLGLDANHVPPLSIAHGVDMSHTSRPMNVDGAEPIH